MAEGIEKVLQLGDSVKRWRTGIAGGLAAVILGFAGWTGYQYASPSQNTSASVKVASEPRWLGRYADMRKRYDKQIEEGIKYVGEMYGIARSDIRLVTFDEIHYCEQGIMSPPCPIQEGLFAAYSYPTGYVSLVVGNDEGVMEYHKFDFPNDPKKREALKFFGEQSGGLDGVVEIIRIDETRGYLEIKDKKPEEDYLFRIYLEGGWESFRPSHGTLVINLKEKNIEHDSGHL